MIERTSAHVLIMVGVVLFVLCDHECAAFQPRKPASPLGVVVETMLRGYEQGQAVLAGEIQVSDHYAYGYRDAQKTHHSLVFQHVLSQSPRELGERLHVYLKRDDRRQAIIDQLLAPQVDGNSAKSIRVKLRSDDQRRVPGGRDLLELVDFQFPTADGKGWGDWQIAKAMEAERAIELAKQAELEAQKEVERIAARTRVWQVRGSAVKAEFVSSTGGLVSLRKPDGTIIKVLIDNLSPEDRDWIRKR
jgi:hypothetical protein